MSPCAAGYPNCVPSDTESQRAMMMCHQTMFSCKRISCSEDSHILIIWSFTETLTLKTANQCFWKTVWLMVMHYRTEFGSIRFSISEDSISRDKQSLTFLNCAVNLTLNTTIQFLHKTLWLMIMYYETKFCSKRISNLEDNSTKLSYFDHTSPYCDLDLENSKQLFFAWHSSSL